MDGTAGNDVIAGGGGFDAVNIGQGGSGTVLVDASDAGLLTSNGFKSGTLASGGNILNFSGLELRNGSNAEYKYQQYKGSAIRSDTVVVNFATLVVDAAGSLASFFDTPVQNETLSNYFLNEGSEMIFSTRTVSNFDNAANVWLRHDGTNGGDGGAVQAVELSQIGVINFETLQGVTEQGDLQNFVSANFQFIV